jgi:hypothetical protein
MSTPAAAALKQIQDLDLEIIDVKDLSDAKELKRAYDETQAEIAMHSYQGGERRPRPRPSAYR